MPHGQRTICHTASEQYATTANNVILTLVVMAVHAVTWVCALDKVLLGEIRIVACFLVASVDSFGIASLAV